MNNIRLGSLILASAGAVCLAQMASLKGKQVENRRLTLELAEAQTALQSVSVTWTNAEADLKLRRGELKSAEAELRIAMQESHDMPLKPLDPEHEGSWPSDQQYFYLAKRHLGQIGYSPFSFEGGVSPAAGFLFGMSEKEKSEVDEAFKAMRAKANQIQRSKAERVEPKPGGNNDNHQEVSYKVSAMTNEVQELRGEFNSAVRQALGSTRADLFLDRAVTVFEADYSGNYGTTDYIITSEANRKADGRVEYTLKLEEPGVGTAYFPFDYPLEPGMPAWEYRHLFGEEPLIPSQTHEPTNK
jgi:hypothetical protein